MITITIKTDNAAFGEDNADRSAEVARIVKDIARQIENWFRGSIIRVQDFNGNTVGDVRLTGKDRKL